MLRDVWRRKIDKYNNNGGKINSEIMMYSLLLTIKNQSSKAKAVSWQKLAL